jgi:hypothetical protein
MKNVEAIVSSTPYFRVRVQGAPPPTGWFVKYLSGMEAAHDIRPGYWLAQWDVSSEFVTFRFEPELILRFEKEADALGVSNALRESADIETEVVRIGI